MIERVMYLIEEQNVIISEKGIVIFECGHFHGLEGCESTHDKLHENGDTIG